MKITEIAAYDKIQQTPIVRTIFYGRDNLLMPSSHCARIAANHHEFQICTKKGRMTNLDELLRSHYARTTIKFRFVQMWANYNKSEVQKLLIF